jgi:tripartite-type tricarboxylate transporter receptor subunit TctC
VARLVAPKLGEVLKTSVVIDNKPGASGWVGLQALKNARPDGHTVYLGSTSPLILNPLINPNVKFSVTQDVLTVNTLARTAQLVATSANSKHKTLKQLADASKAGSATLATSGVGSNSHMLLEVINSSVGSKISHVPYKGTGPAIIDTLSGQVDALIADYPGVLGYKDGKSLNVLAVAEAQRSPLMPNVPTLKEALGIDVDLPNWFAFVVPKGTPDSVRKTLQDAISATVADKEIQQKLVAAGYVGFAHKSQAELDTFVKAEEVKLRAMVTRPEVLKALQQN